MSKETNDFSDGYHTFGELYEHRRALTAALCIYQLSWRSKQHNPDDSPIFEGYFIVGIQLTTTDTITYHYALEHWDDFSHVPELPFAPKWDGASAAETPIRLFNWINKVRK